MKKWFIVLLGIIFVSIIIYLIEEVENSEINEICFEENCFSLEISDTPEKRARGLMFRENLCDDCGMLFVYDEEINSKFWMKNMLIPLDIIWLDSDLKVIHVANAVPCVMEECEIYGLELEKSRYVLEVNFGVSERIGLGEGSDLEFVYGN